MTRVPLVVRWCTLIAVVLTPWTILGALVISR